MRWTVSMDNLYGDWPVRSYTFHVSRSTSANDVHARFEHTGEAGAYVRGERFPCPLRPRADSPMHCSSRQPATRTSRSRSTRPPGDGNGPRRHRGALHLQARPSEDRGGRGNPIASARARTVRFVVGTPGVAWASVWRVWVRPDSSVYVSARAIAGQFKASLHATGDWRLGFQHIATGGHGLPDGRDRVVARFTPARELAPGITRAFTLITPWFAVWPRPGWPALPRGTVWIDPPAEGQVVECMLMIVTAKGHMSTWPGIGGTRLIARVDMPDGRTLWMVYQIATPTAEVLAYWQIVRLRVAHERRGQPTETVRLLPTGENVQDGSWYFLDLPLARGNCRVTDRLQRVETKEGDVPPAVEFAN